MVCVWEEWLKELLIRIINAIDRNKYLAVKVISLVEIKKNKFIYLIYLMQMPSTLTRTNLLFPNIEMLLFFIIIITISSLFCVYVSV